jgi:transposase
MTDLSCYGDLTDTEWFLIEPLLSKPPVRGTGHDLRLVINGVLFLMRSGSPLRAAPPWSTAESYYWHWQADGTWGKIMAMRRKTAGGQQVNESCRG